MKRAYSEEEAEEIAEFEREMERIRYLKEGEKAGYREAVRILIKVEAELEKHENQRRDAIKKIEAEYARLDKERRTWLSKLTESLKAKT
ncbi:MAG: hypothetical protein KA176_01265 [Alphaproteobacteria bacterium]|nr:hypothetical protein [Alphaproteobacteria bacterium]